MGPLIFAHSGALWLATAAVLPIVIHLFSRQRPREVRFPAVRFIRSSKRKTSYRNRLKHLLLLLMRMAAIILLALVIARPSLRGGIEIGDDGPAPADGTPAAVLILDDSLSMGFRAGDETWFEAARNRALELVGQMHRGTAAAVLTTSRPQGKLVRDSEAVANRILATRVTTRANSCWDALESAGELLDQKGASRRDVYLFTDMTESAWLGHGHRVVDLGPDVNLHILNCAGEQRGNGAVYELDQEGEPAILGASLGLKARILASGAPLDRNVQFELDGRVIDRRQVTLDPGDEATLDFDVVLSDAGHHWGRVSFLNPDGLPQDDARAFAVDVAPEVSVLCVEDDPEASIKSVSYFLRLALNPWIARGRGIFRIERASPAQLEDLSLGPFDLVVLAGAGGMTPIGWRRLDAYVSGGGGLLVFLGPETSEAYRSEAAQAVLSAQVGEPVMAPADEPFGLRIVQARHPCVAALLASRAELAEVRYRRCRQVQPGEHAVELMSFGPGTPALVLAEMGGKVALFASTADERWGNFPVTPAFVPFCHEVALYLAARSAGGIRSFPVGAQVPIEFETGRWPTVVRVTAPGAREPERLLPGATPGKHTYWKTDSPGYYAVHFERHGEEWQGGFAVNTVPIESRLEPLPFEQIEDCIRAGKVELVADASFVGGELGGGSRLGELTPYVALAALALLLAECFLANRFHKPVQAEPAAGE